MVVFFFIAGCTSAVEVPFRDCGSKLVKVERLDFDCAGGVPSPCHFKKGSTYHGNISLTVTGEVTTGTIVLHAQIAGDWVPFPISNPNICSHHNIDCPMEEGQHQVFQIELAVPSFALAVDLIAKVEIETTGVDALCFEFLGAISDSLSIPIVN